MERLRRTHAEWRVQPYQCRECGWWHNGHMPKVVLKEFLKRGKIITEWDEFDSRIRSIIDTHLDVNSKLQKRLNLIVKAALCQ